MHTCDHMSLKHYFRMFSLNNKRQEKEVKRTRRRIPLVDAHSNLLEVGGAKLSFGPTQVHSDADTQSAMAESEPTLIRATENTSDTENNSASFSSRLGFGVERLLSKCTGTQKTINSHEGELNASHGQIQGLHGLDQGHVVDRHFLNLAQTHSMPAVLAVHKGFGAQHYNFGGFGGALSGPQGLLAPLGSSEVLRLLSSSSSLSSAATMRSRKKSWTRAVFSNLQRRGLEKRFELQKYITKPDRRQLALSLGLSDAQVKVWFQNRRMKWRHQQMRERRAREKANFQNKNKFLIENLDENEKKEDLEDQEVDVVSEESASTTTLFLVESHMLDSKT